MLMSLGCRAAMIDCLRGIAAVTVAGALAGCIFYPRPQYAKQDENVYRPVDVVTGNPADEAIVRSKEGFRLIDMLIPVTPEGPVNKSVIGVGGFYYYLERGGHRTALPFLRVRTGSLDRDPWDAFMSIGGTWLAFGTMEGPRKPIRVLRFRGADVDLEDRVHVPQRANLLGMQIDRDARTLFFKSRSNDIYRYVLGSNSVPQCIDAAAYARLESQLVAVPGYESAGSVFDAPEPIEQEIARNHELIKIGSVRAYPGIAERALRTTDRAELKRLSAFYGEGNDYLVRWAVAENPATPHEILKNLKEDEAMVVIEAVNRRLYGAGKGPCTAPPEMKE